jgi:flagellar biosynthesis protein FlhF
MHQKRFLRPTVREALAAARETLGPQALVLSTELVQAPGWRGWTGQRVVSLTAATDGDVSEDRSAATKDRHQGSGFSGFKRFTGFNGFKRFSELSELIGREPRRSPKGEGGPIADARRAGIVAKLVAAGVEPALAQAAAASVSAADCRLASADVLHRALMSAIAACAGGGLADSRVEVFIGPPGVGKTTTIAKIAAQERLAGLTPRGVIAADSSRVGAVEHLRGYAGIIGSPFRIARDASELTHALKAARRPVLVDTAGRLPSDASLSSLLAALRARRDVITHLVMPADTSAASACRILDRYADAQPNRIVITKVDEAESAAPLIGVICERKLTVSYVASGPHVPRDLTRATPDALAAVMLGDSPQGVQTCH